MVDFQSTDVASQASEMERWMNLAEKIDPIDACG